LPNDFGHVVPAASLAFHIALPQGCPMSPHRLHLADWRHRPDWPLPTP
jgi:hypothetical protein